MFRGRFILIGVAALVIMAMIFGAVGNSQRDAWTQGYLVGRLTAVEGNAALTPAAPLLPYAYGYPQQGPGVGGLLFLLLGVGAVVFVGSRFVHMAQWRAWAMQQGTTTEGQPNPPWGGPPMSWGCGHPQRGQQQAPPVEAATPPVEA